MDRRPPFPFVGDVFPPTLGAVIQRTVLDGSQPARIVIHDANGDWVVGDGINDPNLPGASVASHIGHVLDRNTSVASLADLPLGFVAEREDPGKAWVVSPHLYEVDH